MNTLYISSLHNALLSVERKSKSLLSQEIRLFTLFIF